MQQASRWRPSWSRNMAERAQRVCRLPGCRNLTRDPSGYCQEHIRGHRKAKGDHKTVDPFYVSSRWRKFREWVLSREPMCQVCGKRPSTVVHHVIELKDGGDPFLPENVRAVCGVCHNRIHKGGGSKSSETSKRFNRLASHAFSVKRNSFFHGGRTCSK